MDKLHILQHSLGLDAYGQGEAYRNRYVSGPGCLTYPICLQMVDDGLMEQLPANFLTGGDPFFLVTAKGKAYVASESPQPPTASRGQARYNAYLKNDGGLSFGEWLVRGMYSPGFAKGVS